jgi:outer membrane protein OmpA-like peptidoglycan-associated protein
MKCRGRLALPIVLTLIAACGRTSSTNVDAPKDTTARESAGSSERQRATRPRADGRPAPEPPPATAAPVPAPSAMSLREGEALAAEIRRRISEDPQIASKNIEVTFVPGIPSFPHDSISLSGTVASEDERDAVRNLAHRLTDVGISSTLAVTPRSGQRPDGTWAGTAPPWNDLGHDKPPMALCPGFTVVTAVASQGDYESIKTIQSMTPAGIRLRYSSEAGRPWWSAPEPQVASFVTYRTVLPEDLETARTYLQMFVRNDIHSEMAPGSTAIGTSSAVLRSLKQQGEAQIRLCQFAVDGRLVGEDDKVIATPAGCRDVTEPFSIRRVGTAPVQMRVLVDGVPMELPAVQARGTTHYDERVEFFFLDDEKNPLTLAFRLGIGEIMALTPSARKLCEGARRRETFVVGDINCDLVDGGDRDTLKVIKISTRCETPSPARGAQGTGAGSAAGGDQMRTAQTGALEQALADNGTVDVYSIYFSFNSDAIREESEPTLKEIAEILIRHMDWRLGINGHTDNVASDAYNLDLSRRRADAVKHALVTQHGVAAERLTTAGMGEGSPKETNDTLEGRARNRRVELVRQ